MHKWLPACDDQNTGFSFQNSLPKADDESF